MRISDWSSDVCSSDLDPRQRVDTTYFLDGALEADDRIEAQQRNRDARVIQVDGSVDDALLHRFGQSFHIDFQADRECRDRADGGTDDFVHAQLISPLDLIAERVVADRKSTRLNSSH